MTARIIRGNALDLPLADSSVDLICTSPPYFGLRSYQDGGQHYEGQIGAEPTPVEFVDALIAATREMMRVLKPAGSIWVNLGDKYSSGGRGTYDLDHGRREVSTGRPRDGFQPKTLLGIPWRYALRCIDDLGMILRAEVVWSKPNGLPESVTDRVRRSHEQWFHLVKQPRYFSGVDEIREPHLDQSEHAATRRARTDRRLEAADAGMVSAANPLGKLPGSVWTIPTQPLRVPPELGVDHFAAYPMEWPRRIIQGWSPVGVCSSCGEGRRPVSTKAATGRTENPAQWSETVMFHDRGSGGIHKTPFQRSVTTTITGYACACPDTTATTTPAVILDPFGGTGTTALMAKVLGRHGVSVDLSADYCRLATWRTNDPGELARAAQVEKPDPVHPDQLDLFGETA